MLIDYSEKKGRIEVTYWLESQEYCKFPHAMDVPEEAAWLSERSIGPVPRDVRRHGEKAIAEWAKRECLADMNRLYTDVMKRMEVREERMSKQHRPPLAVNHPNGVLLQGHIVYCDLYFGRVDLDDPFPLQNDENLSIPNRLAGGIPMFEWDGNLTKEGRDLAPKQLIGLYDREMRRRKHGSALKLVDRLNKR